MIKQLTLAELQARRAANPDLILVEALPEKYFRDWHLPRARHLPHLEVRERAPAVLPDLAEEVVVYCASQTCQNSHIAARELVRIGYANVAVYPGGKQEWSEAQLPVERERAVNAA
jgi:rhodanese-related sulfurtransferase